MYVLLIFVSVGIPLFHYRVLGEALWAIRYRWGLHPVQNLMVWHSGRLSAIIPIGLLVALILSWKFEWLCSPVTLMRVSVALYIFVTVYALQCALALWMALAME
jgi:hypothetical protein